MQQSGIRFCCKEENDCFDAEMCYDEENDMCCKDVKTTENLS